MYYLLYGLLYLFSLLPFFILYLFSDLAFFILYYVYGYRKKVVLGNLGIAFPEKTKEEKIKIAKQFYHNLTDNFIETIKLLSITERQLVKRTIINFPDEEMLISKGLNIQFHTSHQMNWEIGNLAFARRLSIPFIGIYMRISSKPVERLFLKIRQRFGTVQVEKDRYRVVMPQLMKKQYSMGLIADQNPGIVEKGYWLYFFNRAAPFLTGPEKGAVRGHTAVVFTNTVKLKRGVYRYDCKLITEDGSSTQPGELTRRYRDFLEEGIRKDPANYLWSHRRWKRTWEKFFERRWIDTRPHP